MKINIKEVASNRGVSLYKLAHMLGVPNQTIYSWASGRTQPNYKNMDAICQVLKCSMGELFTPEDATDAIEESRKRLLVNLNYKYNKFGGAIE